MRLTKNGTYNVKVNIESRHGTRIVLLFLCTVKSTFYTVFCVHDNDSLLKNEVAELFERLYITVLKFQFLVLKHSFCIMYASRKLIYFTIEILTIFALNVFVRICRIITFYANQKRF